MAGRTDSTDSDSDVARDDGADSAPQRGRLGLSGKLLLLTILFVMLSEIAIFVPSVANYRVNWLKDRLTAAQIAVLVLEATPDNMIPKSLEQEILSTAGAKAIAFKRNGTRWLLMVSDMPSSIGAHFDMRRAMGVWAIADAFDTVTAEPGRLVRVVGPTTLEGGDFVEVVIEEAPLRAAMFAYSVNILTLSIIISVATAALVYLSLNWLLVRPMRRITGNMVRFSRNPEDHGRIIAPSGRSDEIGVAEAELAAMQKQLAGTLKQQGHLAALGLAVSKINHDLRNMLATAQIVSDRLMQVADPTVQRVLPKLLASLDRAIGLCTDTIKYGQAREAQPARRLMLLSPLIEEVADSLGLDGHGHIGWDNAVEPGLEIDADPDQLYRVIMNLLRNAMQIMELEGHRTQGRDMVRITGRRNGGIVTIEVSDTGPGVPEAAREHLFEAFKGSARPGGIGLGLAISAEIVRAHGGEIRLIGGTLGATFQVIVPDRVVDLNAHRPAMRARAARR